MTVNIVTKEDLLEFRQQLLNDLKSIIQTKPNGKKQWLKLPLRVHAAVLHHGGGHAHQQHQPHGHQPQRARNNGQLLVPVQVKREEAGNAQQQLVFP